MLQCMQHQDEYMLFSSGAPIDVAPTKARSLISRSDTGSALTPYSSAGNVDARVVGPPWCAIFGLNTSSQNISTTTVQPTILAQARNAAWKHISFPNTTTVRLRSVVLQSALDRAWFVQSFFQTAGRTIPVTWHCLGRRPEFSKPRQRQEQHSGVWWGLWCIGTQPCGEKARCAACGHSPYPIDIWWKCRWSEPQYYTGLSTPEDVIILDTPDEPQASTSNAEAVVESAEVEEPQLSTSKMETVAGLSRVADQVGSPSPPPLIRKSKDYVYGIWVYKALDIWKGYYRVKKSLVSYMKPWTEARNNKYMKYHSKLTYQLSFWNVSRKVDYHAGGKWFIHGPKRRKENQLLSLKHPCWLSLLKHVNRVHGNMFSPLFKKQNPWTKTS